MTNGSEEAAMRCTRGFLAGGRRVAFAISLAFVFLLAFAGSASAHPLGNFTINRYARVEVSTQIVRVYYVLDEAEIPTFQDRSRLDSDRQAFASQRADDIAAHLSLIIDGRPVSLHVGALELTLPPGQGGLPTLRLAIRFEGQLPSASGVSGVAGPGRRGTLADANEVDRIGWREIVVVARGDARIVSSSAPTNDVSDELRHYPADLIQAPLNLRAATFDFVPGTVAVSPLSMTPTAAAPKRYGGSFTALIQRHLTPWVLLGMLAVALLFGAGHALAPGHGKTIMAAYLVGTKGRPRDALLLGGIVSIMHTASVLVLGLALVQLSHSASPDRVYPWLKLASGAAVALVGSALLWSRWRALGSRRQASAMVPVLPIMPVSVREPVLVGAGVGGGSTEHLSAEHLSAEHLSVALEPVPTPHHHDLGHSDAHLHPHSHSHDGIGDHTHELPEGVAPLSRRGLVVLATAGGLFPSPSALIVLLAAFQLHRVGLGLALIGAFSVGLASTLTAVGLALVYGRRVVERRGLLPALRLLPLASAAAIVVLGVAFAFSGIHAIG
jgi:nickel/cobalt transporter (NicO) family protein